MPTLCLIGLALTALALVVALWAEHASRPAILYIAKPLASTGFLLSAYGAGALDGTPWGQWLFVGLVLCMAGDIFLMPRDNQASFKLGIVAFLLGHVAYTGGFVTLGLDTTATGAAAAGVLVAVVVVMSWLWPHVDGPMRGPVAAYVVVISAMVTAAFGTFGAGHTPWLVIGAVAFYASDLSVARQRFVKPALINRLWGLPTYYAAQHILALTPLVMTGS